VTQKFIEKLIKTINQIANTPSMCPESEIKKNVRRCVVTKHTILFYRVNKKEIEIITIQDTRQNPAF
jgi:plasmid stabilization system protein ParE